MVDDHQVIDRTISYEELALAVEDDPTGRYGGEDVIGIVLCPLLIVIADDLQGEESSDEDTDDDEGEPDDQPASAEELVVDHRE